MPIHATKLTASMEDAHLDPAPPDDQIETNVELINSLTDNLEAIRKSNFNDDLLAALTINRREDFVSQNGLNDAFKNDTNIKRIKATVKLYFNTIKAVQLNVTKLKPQDLDTIKMAFANATALKTAFGPTILKINSIHTLKASQPSAHKKAVTTPVKHTTHEEAMSEMVGSLTAIEAIVNTIVDCTRDEGIGLDNQVRSRLREAAGEVIGVHEFVADPTQIAHLIKMTLLAQVDETVKTKSLTKATNSIMRRATPQIHNIMCEAILLGERNLDAQRYNDVVEAAREMAREMWVTNAGRRTRLKCKTRLLVAVKEAIRDTRSGFHKINVDAVAQECMNNLKEPRASIDYSKMTPFEITESAQTAAVLAQTSHMSDISDYVGRRMSARANWMWDSIQKTNKDVTTILEGSKIFEFMMLERAKLNQTLTDDDVNERPKEAAQSAKSAARRYFQS